MSDTPEPLAAILAEARNKYTVHDCNECDYRKSCDLRFDCDECKTKRQSISLALGIEDDYFTKLLDRIEAAYKREHAEWHAETDAAKDDRNRVACRMRSEFAAKCRNCERATGNAAALREALEKCNELFRCDDDNKSRLCNLARKADEATQAALAAPARNCDRFQTEEEAYAAFMGLFDHFKGERHYQYCRWLFAPAEGGAE